MLQRILDGVTTIAVLAVCILILVQAARSYSAPAVALAPATVVPRPSTAPASPAVGDRLAPITGIDFSASPRTLVMAVQSSCHFCSESMAFYRELGQRRSAANRLAVVAPDDVETAKKYVAAHGFAPDLVATSDLTALNVRGTPTLLLVNAAGVIERVWMGKLTAQREQEVLAEVTR